MNYPVVPIQIQSSDELPSALAEFNPSRCVVLNWFEGVESNACDGAAVTQRLDELGFTYTGSAAVAWQMAQNKFRTKRVLRAHAIPTPRGQVLQRDTLHDWTTFPAIVKVANDHGSEHLTFDSVVHDTAGLVKRFNELGALGVHDLMVAEYIEGQEFTVALWGNGRVQALPLVQVDFSALPLGVPHIRTFDAKWDDTSAIYHTIKLKPALDLSPQVQRRIERVARAAYRAFGLRDYGRIDIRLRDGTPFVIDVNANPDITFEGSFFAAAQFSNYSYPEMLDQIVRLALHRKGN
ncbi:MAG: hypothetical protein HZB51_16520 [Chloroflexi bacterium]|nr:hypothetical protein [Chloroflexota bacterium]